MPRIPSGIVRTLRESFNPFVHRSIPSCIVQSLRASFNPFVHRSNPVFLGSNPPKWDRTLREGVQSQLDCPDTEHERVRSLQNRVETWFWSQETLSARVSGQQNWVRKL